MKLSVLISTLVLSSLYSCHGVNEDDFKLMKSQIQLMNSQIHELQQEARHWKTQVLILESKIAQLQNNTDLEERVDALEEDVVVLENGLAIANSDIIDLQDSQIIQDERFLAVEADVTDLEDDVNALEDSVDGSVSSLESRIDDLETAGVVLQYNVTDLDETDDEIRNDLSDLEQHVNETVGFNTRMSGGNPRCIDDILQFQNDLLNVGQRYDPDTGKFTADHAGLYHFAVYLVSKHDQDVTNATTFHIQKNGENKCILFMELDIQNPVTNRPGSCAATIEMLPGDEVYVACGNVNVLTSNEEWNGFTGFLVRPYL